LAPSLSNVQCSFTAPQDKAKGKKNKITPGPVLQYALDTDTPYNVVDSAANFRMEGWDLPCDGFDIGVVASFGYFIPDRIIARFPLGMINVHPSLLPKYRGAAPIQHALLNGDAETGCSIIRVHPTKMDGGDILSQSRTTIADTDTFASLYERLAEDGARQVMEVLQCMQGDARSLCPMLLPQAGAVVKAPKLERSRGEVCLRRMGAEDIHTTWRALHGFLPIFCRFRGLRVQLHQLAAPWTRRSDVDVLALMGTLGPEQSALVTRVGSVVFVGQEQQLLVRCGAGDWLPVERLQIQAKSVVDAYVFANAYIDQSIKRGSKGAFYSEKVVFE
jgi:methionyl-tRNA formyltransferase